MSVRIVFILCLTGLVLFPLRAMEVEAAEVKSGVNGCVTCHAGLDDEELSKSVPAWHQSVHKTAAISCQDCHGGSPKTMIKEQAHDPNAGYVGIPDPLAVPGLCGKCHELQLNN